MDETRALSEEQIARVTTRADADFLAPVISFVGHTAEKLGMGGKDAGHLKRAVETVCQNVIDNAFGPDDDGRYEVHVLRRPGKLVLAVEDQGLPFDYTPLQDAGDRNLAQVLHQSSADEVRFVNLGRRGNRVELVKHLPHADVREHLPEDEHHATLNAPAASEDVPIEIRMMRPEESFELSRCVYRSYGYS
jgi:anti-sigma regulatory factor (Ser/Thr protein kinase)